MRKHYNNKNRKAPEFENPELNAWFRMNKQYQSAGLDLRRSCPQYSPDKWAIPSIKFQQSYLSFFIL